MNQNEPVAFLSYARADDEHDRGRITALRNRLEGEVRMHTGRSFKIFQDKKDLTWGQHWKDRLDSTLLSVTFLIPVITPSYFYSSPCRDEFEKFLVREKQLGENRLILPIYYLDADQINESNASTADSIAKIVASRNWADWRSLRFRDLLSADVEMAISDMARTIKTAMRELEGVIAASNATEQPSEYFQVSRIIVEAPVSTEENIEVSTSEFPAYSHDIIPLEISTGIFGSETSSPYYAFTKQYDEEILAADLTDEDDLEKFRAILNKSTKSRRRLNKNSIDKFVAEYSRDPASPIPAVTILLDNSGSMRGKRIADTAAWACIISELLDDAHVPNEVLGFTTRAWKGGMSREYWLTEAKPKNPGRLNDLRHIVYKEFSDSAKTSLPNFGLMEREGLLKENIDGEAILWAYNRLVPDIARRRIFIVLTDGKPVDDSTLLVNPGDFLTDHLFSVIDWIESRENIKIFGVGIEVDASNFYKNNIIVNNSTHLGRDLLKVLPTWLK